MPFHRPSLRKKFALVALIAGAFASQAPQAQAVNFWWDGVGSLADAASQGGTGNWDAATTNWDDGAALVVWPATGTDNDAIFGGAAGLVTLQAPLNVNDLTFETTGYEITGSALNILTLNGASANTVTTGAGIDAKISAVLAGSTGLTKSGVGKLTLTGANTFTGALILNAGTLRAETNAAALGAGTLTLTGGTLELAADASTAFNRTTSVTGDAAIVIDRVTTGAAVTQTLGAITFGGTGTRTLNVSSGSNNTSGTAILSVGVPTFTNATNLNIGANTQITATGNSAGAGALTLTGPGTLRLQGDPNHSGLTTINAGVLEIASTAGSTDFNTVINSGGTLRHVSGNYGDAYDVTVNAGGIFDLRLNDTIQELLGSGTVTNGGATNATLTIGSGSPAAFVFSGVIQNGTATLGLSKSSNNLVTLTGANTYTGTTQSNSGLLLVSGNAGSIVGSATINVGDNNGGGEAITIGAAADVWTTGTALNRLANTVTINLNGSSTGGFTYQGPATGSNGFTETIGTINFSNGRNNLTLIPTTGNEVQLSGTNITRANNGTGLIRGTNLGGTGPDSSRIVLSTAPAVVGNNGVDGGLDKSILPFVVGDNSVTGAGTGFLTYNATNGLRLLTAAEYDATIAGTGALRNVTTAGGETVASNERINSLRLTGTGTTTINTGAWVGLNSSALLFTGAGTLAGAGKVDFGTEGFISVAANTLTTATINSRITGSGTLTINSMGSVSNVTQLGGDNTFAGTVVVNGGILRLGSTTALNDSFPVTVLARPGTTVQLNGNSVVVRDLQGTGGSGTYQNGGTTNATLTSYLTADRNLATVLSNGSTGTLGLTLSGNFTFTTQVAHTATGAFEQRRGATTFSSSSSTAHGTAAFTSYSILGGTLRLTNNGTSSSTARLSDTAPVTLNAGTFDFDNNAGTSNYAETIGAVTLAGGSNTIIVDKAATSQTSALTLASLTRSPGAVALLNSPAFDLGTTTQNRLVITAGTSAGFMGAWAVTDSSATARQFVKYVNSGTVSVTALAAGDYTTTLASGSNPTQHIRITATPAALTGATEINSLTLDQASATAVDLGAFTLRVESGGIIANNAFNSSIVNGNLTAGVGNDTAGELVIHNVSAAANPMTLSAAIVNNGTGVVTLTKAGAGVLSLTGTNTYTGKTFLNGGTTQISADNNLGAAPGAVSAGHLTIANSGTLQITETMTLNANRSLHLNPGATNTISITAGATAGTGKVLTYNGRITSTGEAGLVILSNASGTNAGPGSISAVLTDPVNIGGLFTLEAGSVTSGAGNSVIGRSFSVGTNGTASYIQSSGTLRVGAGIDDTLDIGVSAADGVSRVGSLNLAGTTNFTANVSTVRIGVVTGGTATALGSSTFATNNDINAGTSILIGDSGSPGLSNQVLTFGTGVHNITTPLLTWGGKKTSASLTLGAAGTINLSGFGQRTMTMYVGRQNVDTSGLNGSTFTATNGTVTGSFNSLIIGEKIATGTQAAAGGSDTSMTLGSSTNNFIETNTLTLGSFSNATAITTPAASSRAVGTLNMGGGTTIVFNDLAMGTYAGVSNTGVAKGVFNLTGGSLVVGGNITKTNSARSASILTVNGATASVSLQNTADGDLTPGDITLSQLNFLNGVMSNVNQATLDGRTVTDGITVGNAAVALTMRDVTANFPVSLTNSTANQGGIKYEAAGGGAGGTLNGTVNLGTVNRTIDVENSAGATNDLTITGAISGTGAVGVTKIGAGQLALSGASDYTGTTTISAGVLQLGTGSTGGSLANTSGIVNNAALAFNRSNALTVASPISGTGTVSQIGNGVTTLTGTHSYTGTTTVSAGTLLVNGSIATSTNTTVASGATIGGSGIVGPLTLSSGSILSPGNSPGTLSAGNTTWSAGGSYLFEVNNAAGNGVNSAGTNWDTFSVTGNLDISTLTAGNPFVVNLSGLTAGNVAGVVPGFVNSSAYAWMLADATGPLTGFANNLFTVNPAGFINNNPIGTGSFQVVRGDNPSLVGASGLTAGATDNTQLFLLFNASVTASGTTYNIATAPGTLNILKGGNLAATSTITNAGTGSADQLNYSALSGTSVNSGIATTSGSGSGGPLAQGASSLPQTFNVKGIANGSTNVNGSATVTNATVGGAATPGTIGTISVVVGYASFDGTNSSTTFGAPLSTLVAANTNYDNSTGPLTAGWESNSINAMVTGGGPAKVGTTATIVRYDNSSGGTEETVSMAWRSRTATEADLVNNPKALLSDIVRITGMGAPNTNVGTFVLEMTYDLDQTPFSSLNETAIALSGELQLGWFNPNTNQWVNAIAGNIGGATPGSPELRAPTGSDPLGTWGIDTSAANGKGYVWAVLNHNSDFAVIPEPSTFVLGGLALLGFAGVGLRRRRSC